MTNVLKLTPELHTRIVKLVKAGAYIETAAASAGISKQTIYTWLRRGQKGEEPFATFSSDLNAALADDELRSVLQVEQLAGGATATRSKPCPRCKTIVAVPIPTNVQLQALTWKLERKFPERYGHQLKIEHKLQGAVEELLEQVKPRMSEAAYAELVTALAEELGVADLGPEASALGSDEHEKH